LVSPAGFEPAASWSRTTRAGLLRYSEKKSWRSATPPRGTRGSTRSARGGDALPHPSCQRAGTPPGIRTRNIVFLRHARIPYSASGARKQKQKSPGTSRVQAGLWKQKSPERLRGPGRGSERYSASSPPRPNARRPRLASGDAARTCLRKSPGAKVALRSSSLVIALFPQRKRARILLIARAKVNIFFREPG
jgi:hypothetical protein